MITWPLFFVVGLNETKRRLPSEFLESKQGEFAGGVELAFMSTTTDLNIAREFSGGPEEDGTILEITFDAASRGANVQWVSQFPVEAELLYPPCTYLTSERMETIGSKRHIFVRASVSTARHDVNDIADCDTWPDEDARVEDLIGKLQLDWNKGVTRFYRFSLLIH